MIKDPFKETKEQRNFIDNNLDAEVKNLCSAINKLPGIMTIESCYGHGNYPYRIWIVVKGLKYLPPLTYYLDT